MATDLAPLASVQDAIKARIKAEFVNLIPDDMWKALVEEVVTDFITDKQRDRWDTKQTAPIKEIVRKELEEQSRTYLKAEIDRLGPNMWNNGSSVVSEALRKLIADNFKDLLASTQAAMVDVAVQLAVNHMRQSMQRM